MATKKKDKSKTKSKTKTKTKNTKTKSKTKSKPQTKTKTKAKAKPKKKRHSFLKKGQDANEAVDTVEKEYAARKEQMGKPRRFWLDKNGEDARITFLDGGLDKDGLLMKTCFHEHHVQLGGKWGNHFVCPGEFEACPICAEGKYPKEFVAVFTIVDHRKFEANDGKVYKNQKRLYVCKTGTLEQLQTIATKKGGLVGATFDVTRTGDKKAKVGDIIIFDKKQNMKKIAAILKKQDDTIEALDYEECFPSYTAAELEELFGFTLSSVGSEMEVDDDEFDDEFDDDDDAEDIDDDDDDFSDEEDDEDEVDDDEDTDDDDDDDDEDEEDDIEF